MKSNDLRKLRSDFRISKNHVLSQPASLIVNNADDPTTMFNTAGMQPLVPYLMGKEHPTGSKRVFNIQGCVRTVDIDEVGDISHLTYFEMMGNRSLGDYFKQEAITWSWEFLTEIIGLDKEMLCVTIFEGDKDAPLDQEAKDIWLGVGVENDRIVPLGKSDNRWGPAGATGPCGPDTEIFYRVGSGIPPTDSTPGNDEDNRLEIWNNVFMGYYKDADGNITEMENKNVDTGMGFERILMVIKGQELKQGGEIKAISELSVYDIDIFQSLLQNISEHTNISYDDITQEKNDLNIMLLTSFRIVADHLKTSLMLIQQGLAPSNEGRGYVLRRITRRGYYHLKKISVENTDRSDEKLLSSKIDAICSGLPTHYAQLSHTYKKDIQMLVEEMSQFESALQRGGNKIDEILSKHSGSIFSGDDAFLLYDTFGVPVELTVEIVASQGLEVDMLGYEAALETAKQTSRAGAGDKFAKGINRADHITGLSETRFIGYTDLECSDANILKDFEVGGDRYIVFDCTPFYAQGGGQNGDSGSLQLDTGEQINIVDVIKYAGVFLHKIG